MKKSIQETMFFKIVLKYKNDLKQTQNNKEEIQKQINIILNDFIEKTGHEIKEMKITKEKENYKLILEIK